MSKPFWRRRTNPNSSFVKRRSSRNDLERNSRFEKSKDKKHMGKLTCRNWKFHGIDFFVPLENYDWWLDCPYNNLSLPTWFLQFSWCWFWLSVWSFVRFRCTQMIAWTNMGKLSFWRKEYFKIIIIRSHRLITVTSIIILWFFWNYGTVYKRSWDT